jgi:hypothetical protein
VKSAEGEDGESSPIFTDRKKRKKNSHRKENLYINSHKDRTNKFHYSTPDSKEETAEIIRKKITHKDEELARK